MKIIEEHRQKLLTGRGLSQKIRQLIEDINYKDYLLTEYSKNEKH